MWGGSKNCWIYSSAWTRTIDFFKPLFRQNITAIILWLKLINILVSPQFQQSNFSSVFSCVNVVNFSPGYYRNILQINLWSSSTIWPQRSLLYLYVVNRLKLSGIQNTYLSYQSNFPLKVFITFALPTLNLLFPHTILRILFPLIIFNVRYRIFFLVDFSLSKFLKNLWIIFDRLKLNNFFCPFFLPLL